MSDIDRIIATCRRDSRCVSGSERRALCDEIERIRAIVSDLRAQAARLARADCCEKAELLDEIVRLRAFIADRVHDRLLWKHGGYHGRRIYLEAQAILAEETKREES